MEEELKMETSDVYAQEQLKMEKSINIMENIIKDVMANHKKGKGDLVKEIAIELYKNGIGVENTEWN